MHLHEICKLDQVFMKMKKLWLWMVFSFVVSKNIVTLGSLQNNTERWNFKSFTLKMFPLLDFCLFDIHWLYGDVAFTFYFPLTPNKLVHKLSFIFPIREYKYQLYRHHQIVTRIVNELSNKMSHLKITILSQSSNIRIANCD